MKLGTLSILLSVCVPIYVMEPSNGQPSKEHRIANLEQQIVEIRDDLGSCKEVLTKFAEVLGEGDKLSFNELMGKIINEIYELTKHREITEDTLDSINKQINELSGNLGKLSVDLIKFEQEHHVPELIKLDQEQLKLKQRQQQLEDQFKELQKKWKSN